MLGVALKPATSSCTLILPGRCGVFSGEVAGQVGARTVAVGHNADDQAETVLMHFLRGAGLAGLRGMLPKTPFSGYRLLDEQTGAGLWLVRPLLETPRAEIETYCAAHDLQPRFDRSNLDTTYFRNRLRHELLPHLESYRPNIQEVIRRTAQVIAADYTLLREVLEETWPKVTRKAGERAIVFDLEGWRALPLSLKRATLREAVQRLRRNVRNVNFVHIEDAVRIAGEKGTGAVASLPKGLQLTVGYDSLVVADEDFQLVPQEWPPLLIERLPLTVPGRAPLPGPGGWEIEAEWLAPDELPPDWAANPDPWRAFIAAEAAAGELALRQRQPGDSFQPRGMGGHRKSLSDFLINVKVPAAERDVLVLRVVEGMPFGEVAAALTAAEEAGEDADEMVQAVEKKLAGAERLMALAGPEGLNQALQTALDLGYGRAAVELMGVMQRARATGPALEKALSAGDKKVRYNAAVTLADLGRVSDEVVKALAFALRETAVREILVIDDRSDSRNALINDLNEAGYFAVGAENGVQGLLRAKAFPLKDLVILRVELKDMTADKVIFELASGDTSKVPVILLADEGKLDDVKQTWEGKVAGFISSPPSKDVYLPVVKDAMGETLNPERAQAVAMSRVAAQALHSVDPTRMAPYLKDLLAALDKPDEVKVPVLHVLEGIGDPSGLERVAALFGDESASVEVRAAAAGALGAMLSRLQGPPDKDLLDLLAAAVGSDDARLSAAAAVAAGKASGLAPEFVDTLLARYRIE